jgi:hypothetical protein
MLQDAEGEPATAVGDTFVIHMDRESLNDYPLGKYDVTVEIREFEKDRLIAWTILGQIKPQIGHVYGYRLEPSADGDPARAVGDTFVVHMDRESLNDYPLGKYDVTVSITQYEQDKLIAWTNFGQLKPDIGHVYGYRLEPTDGGTLVTSFYDWSDIDQHWRDANIFPIVSELALRATLGILDRTVRRGYPQASTIG